ncbi:hypothetical protein C5167_021869 [Papaver somniferum]|uniref:Uncharacterized protein n=1 Tax=Papaver somniferum TaxID=3469 RepID=A0A4Y7JJ79_PAPSO|nr:UPF0481 protein At3g47200-like [Papaver somniferum]RZC60110.1 hypothetical protein C5167_021869 [Papaver somniferum]
MSGIISSDEAEHHQESSNNMHNSKWVIDVKEKLDKSNEVDEWKKICIYGIPVCVKDLNRKAFKPQAVSFGPYHHGDSHLKQMEEHKHRSLLYFLKRSNKPIQSYMDALHRVGKHLVDSYDWFDEASDDYRDQYGNYTDQFLQLMMLDGCFMLEILRTATNTSDDYVSNDPIFSSHGKLNIMPYVRRDTLMLQNQLPMLLMDTLLAVENGGKPKEEEFLNKIIVKFYTQNMLTRSLGKCLHVVDVYRKNLLQEPRHKVLHQTHSHRNDETVESSFDIIRSARELYETGIRFKTSKTANLTDISFRGGVLRLPEILVDDTTESTFLNLMAYERFHVGEGSEATAYIFFMDRIIDSAKDVSLLHSKGIIKNALGSDKEVAKLFNELSKDVAPDDSLDHVHKEVSDYCKMKWNEWRANLVHTYFRSPCAVLSVLAATFLMALTIIQTVYAIHPASPLPGPPPST